MRRDWQVASPDRAEVTKLAETLDVPRLLAHCMYVRGITDPESGARFLAPSYDHIGDPFALSGMREACARIERARTDDECVVVFGDYDVDGIAGTALLVEGLREFGLRRLEYGMPNRLEEAYGLSPDRVDWAVGLGATLIITVDNGITAHAAAQRAHERGVDLIVTDHHTPDSELPRAVAVVNPKLEPESYSGREACGAAIAHHLARALTGSPIGLDLAALGTVADIVPLTGENRDIVASGLAQAALRNRPGLMALTRAANLEWGAVTAENIAFQIAPRINAGGRMGDGKAGLQLLLTNDAQEARELAAALDRANQERREMERAVLEDALANLDTSFQPEQRSIVMAGDNWHSGVIGIVASRVQDRYYRPVVMVAFGENGVGRGSARSIAGFDLAAAMSVCGEHLEAHGGHAAAAGCTIARDNFDRFRDAFEIHARTQLPEGDMLRPLNIDAQIALSSIEPHLLQQIERLQPFGHANPAPVFAAFGVTPVADSCRELRGGHLRLNLREGPRTFPAIGFQMGDRMGEIVEANSVDIAFTPQFNTWRGETTIQLMLKDIRRSAA